MSMIIVLDALLKETSVRDMVSLIVKSVLVLGLRGPGFNTWLGHWHIIQGGESHTLSHFMLHENGDKPWTGGPLGSSTDSSLFFSQETAMPTLIVITSYKLDQKQTILSH